MDVATPERPSTAVWSPHGSQSVRTYKPVSFNLSSSSAPSPVSRVASPPSAPSSSASSSSTLPYSAHKTRASSVAAQSFQSSTLPSSSVRPFSPVAMDNNNKREETRKLFDVPHMNTVSSQGSVTLANVSQPESPKVTHSLRRITSPPPSRKETWSPEGSQSSISAMLDRAIEEREKERSESEDAMLSSSLPKDYRAAWMNRTTAATSTTPTTTTATPSSSTQESWNGTISHFAESRSGLPQPQSATVTLLQRNRERRKTLEAEHNNRPLEQIAQINSMNGSVRSRETEPPVFPSGIRTLMVNEKDVPDEAIFMGSKEIVEGDTKHTDSFYLLPGNTETETKKETKAAPKIYGVGPKEKETGMPLALRKSVEEGSQKAWYKSMYKSLHKTDQPTPKEDSVKDGGEEMNSYKPTYVFPEEDSEPEREGDNPYRPSYEFPNKRDGETMTLDRYGSDGKSRSMSSWSPPHARYKSERYKNQPFRIEDYEPGRSSIALKEAKTTPPDTLPSPHIFSSLPRSAPPIIGNGFQSSGQNKLYNPPIVKPGEFSRYTESDTEAEIVKRQRPVSPAQSDITSSQLYREAQRGGDIPKSGFGFKQPIRGERRYASSSQSATLGRNSTTESHHGQETMERRIQREEEQERMRKMEMKRLTAEGRMKRMEEERKMNNARKHSDIFLNGNSPDTNIYDDKYWLKLAGLDADGRPEEKAMIPLNRYEESSEPSRSIARPTMKKATVIRGKARAKYTFNSQNSRELGFRKGDTIIMLRMIDKNWCEGEHHGRVGLFPMNYVEVLMSLDEARTAAILREGQAEAKYNFSPQTAKELELKKGERVTLIRRVDDNWYEGRQGQRQGIFPCNYVEVLREPDTPMVTPASSYAPTPRTGSPGQLSPVSTISNGPAPTIPSAPMSPRSGIHDPFDLEQFNYNDFSMASPKSSPAKSSSSMSHYSNPMMQQHTSQQPPRSASALGSLDMRAREPDMRSREPDMRSREMDMRSREPDMRSREMDMRSREPDMRSREPDMRSREPDRQVNVQSQYSRPGSASAARSPAGARPMGSPLSPPVDRSLAAGRRSPSFGAVKDDNVKPFSDGPNYPAYRAMYTYIPQNKDELELREGDLVYVIEKCDDGWFVGTSRRTKEIGTFPGNYVTKL